jgi:hypothetical protein
MSTVVAVHKALKKAGVEFPEADQKGEGVRLQRPKAQTAPLKSEDSVDRSRI